MEAFGTGDLNFANAFGDAYLLFAFGALVIGMSGILSPLLTFPHLFLNRPPCLHKKGVFFFAGLNISGKHPEKAIQINDAGNKVQRQQVKN